MTEGLLIAVVVIQVVQTIILMVYMVRKEGTDHLRHDLLAHTVVPIHRVVCYQDSILYKRNTDDSKPTDRPPHNPHAAN